MDYTLHFKQVGTSNISGYEDTLVKELNFGKFYVHTVQPFYRAVPNY